MTTQRSAATGWTGVGLHGKELGESKESMIKIQCEGGGGKTGLTNTVIASQSAQSFVKAKYVQLNKHT